MLYGVSREMASEMLRKGTLKIAVYGLGKMGLPLALVFADAGARVTGVDIDENRVSTINSGRNPFPFEPGIEDLLSRNLANGRFHATTDGIAAASQSDLLVILVPVKADENGIDFAPLESAMRMIGGGLRKGSIIVTETTLPPGTTESYIPLLDKLSGLKAGVDYGLAHAPERTMSGRVIRDITESYPKILGGLDEKSLEPLIGIYSIINRKGVVPVSSIRVAEAVKVFEGVYRDVNIALANELAIIGEQLGLDTMEAIRAANTQPYSHIHRPGAGVGGHCIGVYTWFLIHKAPMQARLLLEARKRNLEMPHHMLVLLLKALNMNGRSLNGSRIILLGLSYRGGVKESINSPTLPLSKELIDWGARVELYDPYYTDEEIRGHGLNPFNNVYDGADALVIVTDHPQFKKLDLDSIRRRMRTPIIVDGRHIFLEDPRTVRYYYAAPGIGVRPPKGE